MKAIVILNKKSGKVVMTKSDNIDWLTKTIIDSSEIEEIEYLLDDSIYAYDIESKKSIKIKVNDLQTKRHQIIRDNKLFIALHILK
jgi:hypothetical protein